jgi:hypothetical protein
VAPAGLSAGSHQERSHFSRHSLVVDQPADGREPAAAAAARNEVRQRRLRIDRNAVGETRDRIVAQTFRGRIRSGDGARAQLIHGVAQAHQLAATGLASAHVQRFATPDIIAESKGQEIRR